LEGQGHDAFDGVSYDQLNRIRITGSELGRRSAVVRGDATAAYQPDLGVIRFQREFRFDGSNGFVVSDDIQTGEMRTFTSLIHSDDRVMQAGERQFSIGASGSKLRISIETPAQSRNAIEPNDLTAPGRPGSVDQGERQVRGGAGEVSALSSIAEG
jgi:hypothetical protein